MKKTPNNSDNNSEKSPKFVGYSLPSPKELGLENVMPSSPLPSEADCFALWEQYEMLPNIQEHSKVVAHIATKIATRAYEKGLLAKADIEFCRVAAYLHDIAKSYTIRYGGAHAQIGASWCMQHFKHHGLAQAVLHHVEWPWGYPENILKPVFIVNYADKRVCHDSIVSMAERFDDVFVRYGKSDFAINAIKRSQAKALELEHLLQHSLEYPVHEDTFD